MLLQINANFDPAVFIKDYAYPDLFYTTTFPISRNNELTELFVRFSFISLYKYYLISKLQLNIIFEAHLTHINRIFKGLGISGALYIINLNVITI